GAVLPAGVEVGMIAHDDVALHPCMLVTLELDYLFIFDARAHGGDAGGLSAVEEGVVTLSSSHLHGPDVNVVRGLVAVADLQDLSDDGALHPRPVHAVDLVHHHRRVRDP